MEWVEISGRTLEEAKEIALEQLGVAESDAEVIVLSEPKVGLFGRTPRGGTCSGPGAARRATAEAPTPASKE